VIENKKPIISPSQVSSYTRCGEAYRRRYIEKEITPPGGALARGSSIHKGAELNFAQKISSRTDLPRQDVVDCAVSTYEEIVKHEGVYLDPEEEARGKDIVVAETKDSTARLAGVLMDEVVGKHQPALVEEKIELNLESSTHNLVGIIDMKTEAGNIVDLKTSKKTWSPDKVASDAQFTFYAMLDQAKTGKPPKPIIVENIVDLKKPKSVSFITERGMDDFKPLIQRINAVIDGIAKGNFAPAPADSWACSPKYCGYWQTCRYVNNKRSIIS